MFTLHSYMQGLNCCDALGYLSATGLVNRKTENPQTLIRIHIFVRC